MPSASHPRAFRATALTILLLAALNILLGQFEFAGYDSSMLVDLAWRQHLGQFPYRDFPCMLPPAFYLLARVAFALFGIHWWAFTAIHSLIWLAIATTGLLAIRLTPQLTESSRLQSLFLIALALPLLATNHLWHSALNAEWIVLLLLLLYLQQQHLQPALPPGWLSILLILVYSNLWLGKPNTAIPAILLSAWPALRSSRPARNLLRWLLNITAAAALACILLRAYSISPQDVLRSYAQVSGRPSPIALMAGALSSRNDWSATLEASTAYAIVLALLLFVALTGREKNKKAPGGTYAIAFVGFLITVIGFATDWDIRINDLGPALFALGTPLALASGHLAAFPPKLRRAFNLPRAFNFTLLAAVALLAIVSIGRTRMLSEGPWAGSDYGPLSYRTDPFLGPFAARTELWRVHAIIDREHRDHPTAKLFFGVRLEYQYARLRIPSPHHLPLWWHPGSSYVIGTENTLAHTFQQEHFDTLFFIPPQAGGFERFPLELQTVVEKNFTCRTALKDPIEICHRNL